jgi:hypothetical protein
VRSNFLAEYNLREDSLWLVVEDKRITVVEVLEFCFGFLKLKSAKLKLCCFCWILKFSFVGIEQIGVRSPLTKLTELW